VLSITPSKEAATPLSTPGSDVVSRKRSDIDFDAFSDAKRRKTEKGIVEFYDKLDCTTINS
jgi:hypothetical protein